MRNFETNPEMPPEIELTRERLLKEFPRERVHGLNLERVEGYVGNSGLGVKAFIVLERGDLPKLFEITGQDPLPVIDRMGKEGTMGTYEPVTELAIVVRDRDLERVNGPILTEGLLVHELAHGSSSVRQEFVCAENGGVFSPRVGFALPHNKIPWGWFLEEGWAEMFRADYIAKNISAENRKRLESVIGVSGIDLEDTLPITYFSGQTLPLPMKYLYLSKDSGSKLKTTGSAPAGYALELLCRAHLFLRSVLTQARTSRYGLSELPKILNSISPGLYNDLQRTENSSEAFEAKLAIVIKKLGGMGGAVRASGALQKKWERILQQQ